MDRTGFLHPRFVPYRRSPPGGGRAGTRPPIAEQSATRAVLRTWTVLARPTRAARRRQLPGSSYRRDGARMASAMPRFASASARSFPGFPA